tara:strand:- start:182 stop:523 length:342 start_codon:yes stop_codon:yes gene_type:complete
MSDEYMENRVDETHKAEWHNYAGLGSLISIILPVLSEFEGVGEEFIMGVGGASAASVFVIMMKIGRVTACVGDLHQEQDVRNQEAEEENKERLRMEKQRRKDSDYLNDPIGWE